MNTIDYSEIEMGHVPFTRSPTAGLNSPIDPGEEWNFFRVKGGPKGCDVANLPFDGKRDILKERTQPTWTGCRPSQVSAALEFNTGLPAIPPWWRSRTREKDPKLKGKGEEWRPQTAASDVTVGGTLPVTRANKSQGQSLQYDGRCHDANMVRCSLCNGRGSSRWLEHHQSLCSGLTVKKKANVAARDLCVRAYLRKKLESVITIQRLFRGHKSRRSVMIDWLFLHKMAKKVQDRWRYYKKLKDEGLLQEELDKMARRYRTTPVDLRDTHVSWICYCRKQLSDVVDDVYNEHKEEEIRLNDEVRTILCDLSEYLVNDVTFLQALEDAEATRLEHEAILELF